MKSSAGKIELMSVDDLFSTEKDRAEAELERVKEIPLSDLHSFRNHPFKVIDDDSMKELAVSIQEHGVLSPGIARPIRDENGYELISGHRRKRASELAGNETMPVIIRDMDDDDAVLLMVDSNLQRETILPSEKAFSFRMKLEAIKRQGQRNDLDEDGGSGRSGWAVERVANDAGESSSQIQRYIRLTELISGLLDMVDARKLAVSVAYELSFIDRDFQYCIEEAMEDTKKKPGVLQAKRMRSLSESGELCYEIIKDILLENTQKKAGKVVLSSDVVGKYFRPGCSRKEIEETIVRLLEEWRERGEGGKADERGKTLYL